VTLVHDEFTAIRGDGATIGPTGNPDESSHAFDGPLRVGEAFGNRYHIIRVLGIGGMGAVYQAWDAELGMAVALKVVRPEATADPEMGRRFKQELVLARKVTHKNVVRIHDLGEIDGIKYITMPYLEGSDLATILSKSGKLALPAALRILRDVAAGLAAAHDAGIVHRDLKPANIMIEADHAIIMDFGIARSAVSAAPVVSSDASLHKLSLQRASAASTMVGTVLGTIEYMAPEQAKGQPADQRADIYALGLIFSDMLLGKRQPSAPDETPLAQLMKRIAEAPPPVRSIDPTIPEPIERLISRCLEPDPAARFQKSSELVAELDRLDDNGIPIPEPRRFTPALISAAAVLMVALMTGTWWLTRTPPAPKQHAPVSVLIADLENRTGDTTFDRSLEETLRRGLEGAGFVTAYDRSRVRPTFGVEPAAKFDDAAARALAAKQGVGVVLSGSIDRRGSGYDVEVKAVQTVTGNTVLNTKSRSATKDQVLEVVTRLVAKVRTALGDETADSAQMFAMKSVSSTSLEVINNYAAAIEAQSDGKYEEALRRFNKTVELDPKFGLGYQGIAVMSRNLGRQQDADKYSKEALQYLAGMTDRERYGVRAAYYRMAGDYQQCVKEFGEMNARFPADANGHNNRALCLSKVRNMREAVTEMQRTVEILPKRVLFRSNLAVYMDYATDFANAEREVGAIEEPNDLATLALAFAQLGQGRIDQAQATYQKLATMGARGASWSASGLADLAVYQGRYSDAVRMFAQGVSADLAADNPDRAARKLTSQGYAYLLKGQPAQAIAAADKALTYSHVMDIRFLAARVFAEAGATAKAEAQAAEFAAELPVGPRAYGKIIEGDMALKAGDPRKAVALLTDANGLLDTWVGAFDLGRAYLAAGGFAQADSAFDACIQRRGEALAVLVDEEPTYGWFPQVYYFQGRVREGLNTGFVDSYREYLNIRGTSREDPLLPEVRKRDGV
jgi:serine/threonine protein kinase/tetratricopeptide (TPR) repeat protein